MAWALAAVATSVGVSLVSLNRQLPLVFWLSFVLLLVVAIAITFSHWLERRTMIILEDESVIFQSPLRSVMLPWEQIEKLACIKIQRGWRFMVSGKQAAFRFQSMITLRSGFGREVRSGYDRGLEIARFIQHSAKLDQVSQQDQVWIYSK
jgi:uncharacterized membrane-anchored protein